jgi:uncharacterized YigZ family protein
VKNPHAPAAGNDPPDSFRTLAGTAETELKIQRSRFLAFAFPIESEPGAQSHLDDLSHRYHDARHFCFGYKLGVGPDTISRKSDAGEPSGTAGEPIINSIGKMDLTDVLVIVVRYFGGIKLGTGGLARAYGQAAGMALAEAGAKEVSLGREFILRFPYTHDKTIRRLLEKRKGHLVKQNYDEKVVWRIWLPHSVWRGFAETLTELTAGTVALEEPEE